jgi:cytosine/adenosine deaminase-related metal-dependent hydrolase
VTHAPYTLVNTDLGRLGLSSIRVVDGRIAAIGAGPPRGDIVIDAAADRVLPGLINAHDHLQLNSFPHLAYRERYTSAAEWIEDFNDRIRSDPNFQSALRPTLDERLFAGGMKNLLCGVTTVAHHDPLFSCLRGRVFPVRVVTEYGWSHSLHIDGEVAVAGACMRTGDAVPWIIHAAEGTDASASEEFDRLERLGCIKANTLIVHGVALTASQRERLEAADAGLVWCPASNLRLFGRTADVTALASRGRVALGTDSRMTGARDLLEELRVARTLYPGDSSALEAMVTVHAAQLLRLEDCGSIQVGARADLLIIPAASQLFEISRSEIRLVVLDGIARYGDATYVRALSPHRAWAALIVDDREKMLDLELARAFRSSAIVEKQVCIRHLGEIAA